MELIYPIFIIQHAANINILFDKTIYFIYYLYYKIINT